MQFRRTRPAKLPRKSVAKIIAVPSERARREEPREQDLDVFLLKQNRQRISINVFNGHVSFFREYRGYLHHSQLLRLHAVPLKHFYLVTMRLLINEVQLSVARTSSHRAAARCTVNFEPLTNLIKRSLEIQSCSR